MVSSLQRLAVARLPGDAHVNEYSNVNRSLYEIFTQIFSKAVTDQYYKKFTTEPPPKELLKKLRNSFNREQFNFELLSPFVLNRYVQALQQNQISPALIRTAKHGNLEMALQILERIEIENIQIPVGEDGLGEALVCAAAYGHGDIVNAILSNPRAVQIQLRLVLYSKVITLSSAIKKNSILLTAAAAAALAGFGYWYYNRMQESL